MPNDKTLRDEFASEFDWERAAIHLLFCRKEIADCSQCTEIQWQVGMSDLLKERSQEGGDGEAGK